MTSQNRPSSSDIKLIVIDDKSLHDIDRWPWRRNYYLEIFDYFETYTNAKLVGYDGLIVSKDANNPKSDEEFFCNVAKFKKLTAGFAFSADNFEAGIDVEKFDKLLNSKFNIQILDKRTKKDLSSPFKSFSALQEVYFENINSLGHVNMLTDSDVYLR
ncbi:CHASE2 domain-containing protein, partial [bacterium]|nr:CHASE2 domain-containing protein [bacterium]